VSEEKEEEEEKGSSERQIYYVACPFNFHVMIFSIFIPI
jgi:hypothetical protein